MVKYEIKKRIRTIYNKNDVSLELNLVKWGNGPAKYDLRKWEQGKPQKGVTLSRDEAEILYLALEQELGYSQDNNRDKRIQINGNAHSNFDENVPEPIEKKTLKENTRQHIITQPLARKECIIDYRNFVVHYNFHSCKNDGHDYEDIKACIPIYENNKVNIMKVDALFCKTCKLYYISESAFIRAKERGRLLCQVASMQEYEKFKNSNLKDQWKTESVLKIFGYSVDKVNDYSTKYRQTVLQYAIETGVVDKKTVISYLNFFIMLNEKNSNMESAVQKWRKDRAFLVGYKEGSEKLVGVNGLITE